MGLYINYMTWGQLFKHLQKMDEQQLESIIISYDAYLDQCYPIQEFGETPENDITEKGCPCLVFGKC